MNQRTDLDQPMSRRRALGLASTGAVGVAIATAGLAVSPQAAMASSPTDWHDVTQSPYNAPAPSNDTTTAIQAALDAAETAGGGIVYLPSRRYKISSELTIGANVTLLGTGPSSYLEATGADFAQVVNFKSASHVAAIRNLRIFGANTAGGIRINTSGTGAFSGSDAYTLVEHVFIHQPRTTGVTVENVSREVRLRSVVVFDAKTSHGIHFKGVDGILSDCTSASCKLDGFRIEGGNNRLTGCKAFFNEECGFYINGNRGQLSGCQAQDNDTDGIRLENAEDVALAACASDSNQWVGIRVRDSEAITFDSASSFSRGGGAHTQSYGIRLQNSTDCCITGVSRSNTTDLKVDNDCVNCDATGVIA